MYFAVRSRNESSKAANGAVVLVMNSWDDYGYQTTFHPVLYDDAGEKIELGSVKIGQRGSESGRTDVPRSFESLDQSFFSLGQGQSYYETLMTLPAHTREAYLSAIRDVAFSDEAMLVASQESVYQSSLLRSVSSSEIERFRGILRSQYARAAYSFRYSPANRAFALDFSISPESKPPTNIHVLIGRNGVGKTFVLSQMARIAAKDILDEYNSDVLKFSGASEYGDGFANVVSVSFSAFDEFDIPKGKASSPNSKYTYIGLRRTDSPDSELKSTKDLGNDFAASVRTCLRSARKERWRNALSGLGTDPGFADLGIGALSEADDESLAKLAREVFKRGSSGHKIVMLTLTRLVETVDDRTIVLLDEPESHLHPPLLSSLIRQLSSLLSDRNGVAVIATHSPVVLQEVPQNCAWILSKYGEIRTAERPTTETFAESVSVLTREVFGLEVTNSGYHNLLRNSAHNAASFPALLDEFDGHVGSEGRAIALALMADKRR